MYDDSELKFRRAGSVTDLTRQSEAELGAIRTAMVEHEGLIASVFDVLRSVPRRVLMVLKLNDLTRYVSVEPCFLVNMNSPFLVGILTMHSQRLILA